MGDAGGTSIGGENCRMDLAPQKNFWVRAGLFVGCRESLQSSWGKLLKEKEISPCLTVRADW
jgi:hypothetical protein